MFFNSFVYLYLILTCTLVLSRPNPPNQDDADYLFNEEDASPASSNLVSTEIIKLGNLTSSTNNSSVIESSTTTEGTIEVDETTSANGATSTEKPCTVTCPSEQIDQQVRLSCPSNDRDLKKKIYRIMDAYFPLQLRLKEVTRGQTTTLSLTNGYLNLDDYHLVDQPLCSEYDGKLIYDFVSAFEAPTGSYNWKITNLFGNDFEEMVIMNMKRLKAQFIFSESESDRAKDKPQFEQVKIDSNFEDVQVKVNMPERITRIRFIEQAMQFIISQITTMVANRSKDQLSRDFEDRLTEAIRDKSLIKAKI